MNNLYVFNKTIHGYRHIQKEEPCEDNSVSYVDPNDLFQIVAVADGHGDPACARSAKGSLFAVQAAEKCFKKFALNILSDNFSLDDSYQLPEFLRNLTNSIVSNWQSSVRNDVMENEITEEEIKNAREYKDDYMQGRYLDHLYGTTLIGGLLVDHYLILVHQGDGRCNVYYADGSMSQPIPWDERCQGTLTTSMCDTDVYSSIRWQLIDLNVKDVVACYLGTDGVEDSYPENEETQLGTHRFYMDLTCKIHELGIEEFEKYLEQMLPQFSESGSADDVSVAGIVSLEKTKKLIEKYQKNVEKYDNYIALKVNFEEAQAKVISMTRKHSILAERIVECEKELESTKKELEVTQQNIASLKSRREHHISQVEQAKKDWEDYQEESERAIQVIEGKYPGLKSAIKIFFNELKKGTSLKEALYRHYLELVLEDDSKIKDQETKEENLKSNISGLEKKLENSKVDFQEYDDLYQKYKNDESEYKHKLNEIENKS